MPHLFTLPFYRKRYVSDSCIIPNIYTEVNTFSQFYRTYFLSFVFDSISFISGKSSNSETVILNPIAILRNSLSSSESILDQIASFRMETELPAALRQDKKYQKAQKNCNKANEKIQDLNLTPQQWDTVDAAITAENISSIEYIRIAYKQGINDAFSILRETL